MLIFDGYRNLSAKIIIPFKIIIRFIYSRPYHVASSKLGALGSQVYTSSSLSPLSLLLSEVSVLDSSPW